MGLFFFVIFTVSSYLILVQFAASNPAHLRVNVGDRVALENLFPAYLSEKLTALVLEGEEKLKLQDGSNQKILQQNDSLIADVPGNINLYLRLFGVIPFKKVTLQVVSPIKVMVGGHSIGVLLNAEGVMVMGYSQITLQDGSKVSPGKDAGLKPGTVILKVEGTAVQSDSQLSYLIDQEARKKKQIRLKIKYKGKVSEVKIRPQFCGETGRYRIGLLVRDAAAGVGTLTFVEPKTKKFGALGHMITTSGPEDSMVFQDGRVVSAVVQAIQKGERGKIGEKIGFFGGNDISGKISKNTTYGIFGRLQQGVTNPLFPEPISVAMSYQVKEGPAIMLTVINNRTIEAFKVNIETVFPRPRADGKSMIIKVTDPDLLRRTGGIIQGMSGSPIIQEGKLVGAVTHVLVNDPAKGYGVFAEMMLEEAGLLPGRTSMTPYQERLAV
ncbi:MAG TPA: SpoIVB peptidase [Syntrophomonadaceae bacterium]|nr:SpoIVB peptidase [Syntrophomonadaceae bacterium]